MTKTVSCYLKAPAQPLERKVQPVAEGRICTFVV